jgi:protein arginine N-methyltransferase 1
MSDPLDEHYCYLADRVKVGRYQDAIRHTVRPEHVVLDLGCGSGLLGLMALRAGAGKVLFVDRGPVIEMARRAVCEAGFGDRASFFQAVSYDLELPDRADIVLCDHVGYFGFDYDILRLLADARRRFLRPGGRLIPGRLEPRLAAVETTSGRSLVQRWRDGSVPEDYAWVATAAANLKHALNLERANLLAEPVTLATLELGRDAAEFFNWHAVFECTRDATLDGLAGWFDCILHGDVYMTNAPTSAARLERPQAFLPLERPLAVSAGQPIEATIMVRPHDHLIAWTVALPDTGQVFRHSTFFGLELESALRSMSHPGPAA